MKKEEKIFEWLMYNNVLYENLDKLTNYNLIKTKLNEQQKKEVEVALSHRGDWSNTVVPIFCGEVCYLENASFITKENIKQSRQYVKEWMFRHIFSIEKDGIVFTNECKCEPYNRVINGNEYETLNNYMKFPELPSSYGYGYTEKERKRNCNIRLIKDCDIYSDLLFKPNSYSSPYDLQNLLFIVTEKKNNKTNIQSKSKSCNLDKKSLIDENGVLRYKIKECQDLYLDMQHNHYCNPTINITSFKNFPDIVHGNFVILYWDNILSFEGFPTLCEKELVFKNCRIPFNAVLPEGVTINENLVCIDCANDYNLLVGILKYNWNIKGKIYTSLYTGTIDDLREKAIKLKWI